MAEKKGVGKGKEIFFQLKLRMGIFKNVNLRYTLPAFNTKENQNKASVGIRRAQLNQTEQTRIRTHIKKRSRNTD